jgi:ribonuclease BN (tRNA processing enzyme)
MISSFWAGAECWLDPGPPRMFAPPGIETFVSVAGSGNVPPNPFRRGPSAVIVVNETPYLIDAGEGIWRSLINVATAHDGLLSNALVPKRMSRLFLTHLHSDHTAGLPSLMLFPWTHGKTDPLEVHGPIGTQRLLAGLQEAYHADLHERLYGPEVKNPTGWKTVAHEILEPGLVYEDDNIKVEAFHHRHGSFAQNFGFRFTTHDRVIVWSGDGQVSDSFVEAAKDADLFFCELHTVDTLPNAAWGGDTIEEKNRIIWSYHMKPAELAELASEAKVKKLVLIHECGYIEPYHHEGLLQELKQFYDGEVISSRDADVF